MKRKNKSNPRF